MLELPDGPHAKILVDAVFSSLAPFPLDAGWIAGVGADWEVWQVLFTFA